MERVGRAEQGTKVGKETPGCTSHPPPSSSSSSSFSPQAGPVVPPCGQASQDRPRTGSAEPQSSVGDRTSEMRAHAPVRDVCTDY